MSEPAIPYEKKPWERRILPLLPGIPAHERMLITVMDDRGPGNLSHDYVIATTGGRAIELRFDRGLTELALLAVCRDRVEGLMQASPQSQILSRALTHLQASMEALEDYEDPDLRD